MHLLTTSDHLANLISQFWTLWLIVSGIRVIIIFLIFGMIFYWIRKNRHRF